MNLNTFLKKFFLKLNKEKIQFCILRNHNSLPKKLISNDIDVLIEKKDIKKIESLINKYFIHFSVLKREYLTSFVIFDINSSNFKSLKIDFLSKISFKGLVYLDNKEIFNQSVSKSGCNCRGVAVRAPPRWSGPPSATKSFCYAHPGAC